MHHVEPDEMSPRPQQRHALGKDAAPIDHARSVAGGVLRAVRGIGKNEVETSGKERKRGGVRLHVRHGTELSLDAAIIPHALIGRQQPTEQMQHTAGGWNNASMRLK